MVIVQLILLNLVIIKVIVMYQHPLTIISQMVKTVNQLVLVRMVKRMYLMSLRILMVIMYCTYTLNYYTNSLIELVHNFSIVTNLCWT